MKNSDKWLTKKEAAQRLKVSIRTIEKWVQSEIIVAFKIGGRVLLDIEQIDQVVRDGAYKS